MTAKVQINWSEVYALAQSQCSAAEISAKVGVPPTTLHRRCIDELGMHLEELLGREALAGAAVLRASQYSTAVRDKNPQMQIWLGKNVLGQRDSRRDGDDTQNAAVEAIDKLKALPASLDAEVIERLASLDKSQQRALLEHAEGA